MTMLRSAEVGDFTGRTLDGRAYRYDYPSRVTDDGWQHSYAEEISRGADVKTLIDHPTFPLDVQHNRNALGTVSFQRSANGKELLFTAQVDHGDAGDKILSEIESWSDASVSFDALRTVRRSSPVHGEIAVRQEIRLHGLSLAANGSGLHKGGEILMLRASGAEAPRLAAVRRRLILL